MQRGDRVLLDLQNGHDFVIACFAILRADAAVVPVSPMNLTFNLLSGGHSSLDSRFPIPNRIVKRVCADDSVQSRTRR